MFKMRTLLLAATAGLAISSAAMAGDVNAPAIAAVTNIPVKAPVQSYQVSGPFFGIYTEAGGGPVNANVPGIATASLTTTSAAIGVTVGYAHKFANGILGTVEADVCAKNFNGSNAGFSLSGPLCMEQRVMIFAPTDQVMNAINFLNIQNPFANLANIVVPNGATVKSSYLGIGPGAYWNDMTIAYQGVGANKVWSVNPELAIMKMDLLTTNSMLRTFAKVDFESQTTVFGAHQSNAKTGVGGRAGLGWNF